MKHRIKKVAGCLVTVLLLIFVMSGLTNLMEKKDSDLKYESFLQQEEEFDVLFMGTSHVINGIFPMELWKNHGIVSYNFGGHQNTLATTYWTMMNALDYTTPEVVVIDCYGLSTKTKTRKNISYSHLSFDAFPLSLTKIRAINDLLDDPVMDEMIEKGKVKLSGEARSKIGFLWDFSVYHSRWSKLEETDFTRSSIDEKGAGTRIGVAIPKEFPGIDRSRKAEGYNVSYEYLEKMIETCQEKGIEVLLTFLPFPAPESEVMNSNRVYDIAEEYDVNYINFLNMDIVDYDTDCYDTYSHLNPSGARKVTDFLGEYLRENYNIKDHRDDQNYNSWMEDYDEYEKYKFDNLKEEQSLLNYLMLLSGENLDVKIVIGNKDIYKAPRYKKVIENLKLNRGELSVKEVDSGNGISIRCLEPKTGEEIDNVYFEYVLVQREDEFSLIETETKRE